MPTGAALWEYWRPRLPEGERKILELLVQAYPATLLRDSISEVTSFARSSRDAYLQRLRARRLVTLEGRATVRASELLFD